VISVPLCFGCKKTSFSSNKTGPDESGHYEHTPDESGLENTVSSLVMIWAELNDSKIVWKSWLTIAVFFLTSALTLSVTKALELKRKNDE